MAPTMNCNQIHGNGEIKIPNNVSRINFIPAAIKIAGMTSTINAAIRAIYRPPPDKKAVIETMSQIILVSLNFTMRAEKVNNRV